MGEIVRFRAPKSQPAAPTRRPADLPDWGVVDGGQLDLSGGWIDRDDPVIEDAYAAAYLAAERYERERRRERDLQARIDALMRENARLREELARKP